jgi:hypothetical protein
MRRGVGEGEGVPLLYCGDALGRAAKAAASVAEWEPPRGPRQF